MDPIADMITSIKNAQAVKKETVKVSYSKIKHNLALILQKEGFVGDVEKKEKKNFPPFLIIRLKYTESGEPAISGAKKISTPGQRIYIKARDIGKIKGGYGRTVISTPQGLLTDGEAKKQKVGGEHIANIW
ncbi:MAG: 30S ribosomal protein S8 [Candidatus Spechtbacteria bacterium RIFCSPLOWO2_01_FULL_46_10]|uniref:Small ribosomal subunit protein uS8 n=1 Tax=Candidatus Spechtbacteria bacterium RIFCSPLOWO2_01_FULL_46_10 TaxID=1802163 RepID=A0A1G2HHH7_9BACT|nr:MAG: 30S ribosomal protein S8 [Candidatus Spechtbacteria bacterium RIFCSPLOWO2_01_FULL_46_10]